MYPDLALLILRVAIGGIVMPHGLLKLGLVGAGGSIPGVAGWFNSLGLRPGLFWAYVAVLAEAGGGLLTILGLGGPIGPGIVAADLVVVTVIAHWPQGFWAGGGKVGWEFPVPLAAGALAIALAGNGDGRWTGSSVWSIQTGSCLPGSCSWPSARFWPWACARWGRPRPRHLSQIERIS